MKQLLDYKDYKVFLNDHQSIKIYNSSNKEVYLRDEDMYQIKRMNGIHIDIGFSTAYVRKMERNRRRIVRGINRTVAKID